MQAEYQTICNASVIDGKMGRQVYEKARLKPRPTFKNIIFPPRQSLSNYGYFLEPIYSIGFLVILS